jgi:hypothetical protein
MGSIEAAFRAGKTPKIIPIAPEKPKVTNTDVREILVLILRADPIILDPAVPRAIPIPPPKTLSTIASIRNCSS